MKNNYSTILIAAALIITTAVLRIFSAEMFIPNVTPVAAVGLFGGAVIADKRLAYILPLLAMFIADVYFTLFTSVKGFYGFEQTIVYAAMALVTFIGTKMGKVNGAKVIGYSLVASFLFFVISNLGYFLAGWNGYSFAGLTKTYVDAIPFYKNSVITDLVGSVALFGLYFAGKKAFAPQTQNA